MKVTLEIDEQFKCLWKMYVTYEEVVFVKEIDIYVCDAMATVAASRRGCSPTLPPVKESTNRSGSIMLLLPLLLLLLLLLLV